MPRTLGLRFVPFILALGLIGTGVWTILPTTRGENPTDTLEKRFTTQVQPFLQTYCLNCHGPKKQSASLDLSLDRTVPALVKNFGTWELVLERIHAREMPPESAVKQPSAEEREAVVGWLRELRTREADRNAGDPGTVLARRLSNAEFDNTVRDLTGVDIRPTREFPVDPANQSGFDNSGESLAMSPALLKKYLAAARGVADHVVLKPEGFVFAPHPVVTDTDRDKYCVRRILDFYQKHSVDLADYFLAAWQYRHRAVVDRADADLDRFAKRAGLSAKYLNLVWSALTEGESVIGPLALVRKKWDEIPPPAKAADLPRAACAELRDLVLRLRRHLKPHVAGLEVNGISKGSQPLLLWRNAEQARRRLGYAGDMLADFKRLAAEVKAARLDNYFHVGEDEAKEKGRTDVERFCSVFPDAFFVTDRTTNSSETDGKGRPLTAGFHLMHGYFRDDEPLCKLILSPEQKDELDTLWFELKFVTRTLTRQYKDFIFFERAEPPRFMFDAAFDFARSEDKDATSTRKMTRLSRAYLAKARENKASDEALEAITDYFNIMTVHIANSERRRAFSEVSHLEALAKFTERAYRRPLTQSEHFDLRAFYHALRKDNQLGHEEAIRDTIASILLSPHVLYRFDLAPTEKGSRPLSDYELANRLSYFLWASMPDAELLRRAGAGDLHKPDVLKAQAQRMLKDAKVRGLATEFAGNWLDFRRFEEHNAVDRERFSNFTNELRQAMFEEPVRYFMDMVQRNRSVLDLIDGTDTFVNRPLAKHYGMPEPPNDMWVRVLDVDRYGRGGLLTMSVFLTKNSPGLRTSPVKRGYWVVRSLLGERIPAPPPTVPELPKDEANLGELTLPQLLARHRADKSCAGCHDRFDSVGLAFEGFGPVGELRQKDLGGKPVQNAATFPDGKTRTGVDGLREYLREKRQGDFIDNLCKKLLSFALGRSLILSDQKQLDAMRSKLKEDRYAFGSLVESIVTSPQFLNKRGRE